MTAVGRWSDCQRSYPNNPIEAQARKSESATAFQVSNEFQCLAAQAPAPVSLSALGLGLELVETETNLEPDNLPVFCASIC
jgi:hypothetical protein